MTASMSTHYAFVPVHVETSTTATATAHAETAKHSKVHASSTAHAPAARTATASLKTTQGAAKHAAKPAVKVVKPASLPKPDNELVKLPHLKNHSLAGGPIPGYFGPPQVATAYGVTALGASNQGQGQTIGIVDAFNDPNILADSNVFSAQYGLPLFNGTGGPTLTVFKDTSRGPVANAPLYSTAGETSLDVQWAHAMAPKANILLVEEPILNSDTEDSYFDGLISGVQYAAAHGASVVSLSYGNTEENIGLPTVYSIEHKYLATGAATGVAVTVSSGDTSYPGFPSSSPNVISVGGTQLHVTGTNAYSYETAWGSTSINPYDGAGGGGPSAFFKTPAYQGTNGVSYGRYRSLPDVSLVADPSSGLSFYDSWDYGSNGWTAAGGTSFASPIFAGILSIVQEDRVNAGKPILTSVQINNALYAAYKSPSYLTYFHDITQGGNADNYDGYPGYTTSTGYDLATGIGSPIANTLVPYLAAQ